MVCKNCSLVNPENSTYCSSCGARFIRNRLTAGTLFAQINEQFLNLDNIFLRTYLTFFTKPEILISDFINGVRKKYLNPVSFFAVSISISGFYLLVLQKYFSEYLTMPQFGDNQVQEQIGSKIMGYTMEYNSFIYALLIPIVAIISLIVFYNKKYNYTEHLVMYLYTFSFISITSSLIGLLILFTVPEFYTTFSFAVLGIYIIYHSILLIRLFNLSLKEFIIKTLIFLPLGFITYIGISLAAVIVLLLTGVVNLEDFRPPS